MSDKTEKVIVRIEISDADAKKKIIDNTTAIRGFGDANKALQKSLKEGKITEDDYTKSLLANKQAVDALQKENKQLDLSLKANENSVEGLRAQIALLTAEANKMDLNSEEFGKAQKQLDELNDKLIEVGKDRSDFRANVGNYGSAVQGFEDHIASLEKKLQGLKIDSSEFKQVRDEIEKTNASLSNLQNGVGSIEGKLNGFGKKFEGISSSFSGLGTTLTAALGPAAIIGGVVAVGAAVISLKNEIDKAREQVNLLTGATGNNLDKITAKVQATSKTFGKDFNETLITANTAAKQFGISVPAALDLIQKGFVNGADATGNFLGDLTEFAPQFKQIGLSAEQSIAILSQQPETGVFSNKGIDAIKEAGIRLQQMPQATKDALDAIGLSSKEISKSIQDGSLTTFEAIQKVSAQLATVSPTAKATADAVEGIFGGKGQDAGLDYLKTISTIDTSLDSLTKKGGEFANANLTIVKAQEKIDLLFNQTLGSGGNMFKSLKAGALDFTANALEAIINGIVDTINWFRQLYNESIIFRGAIQLIKATVETTFSAIKFTFNQFVEGLKAVGALIKAVFTGNFKAIPDLLDDAFTKAVDNTKAYGKEVAQNFIDAAKETLEPAEILAPISLGGEDPVKAYYGAGLDAGNNFNKGIKQTREDYLKDQKAFLQSQLLLTDANSQKALELTKKIIDIDRDIQLQAEGLTGNQKLLIHTQALVDVAQADKDFYEKQKADAAARLAEQIKNIEDGEAMKTAALEIQYAQKTIDEQTYQDNLFAIREAALEAEIKQFTEGSLEKIQAEADLEKLRSDQKEEARKKEMETSDLLRDTEVKNDQARLESAGLLAQGIADIAGQASLAGKIAAAVSKGLALADVVFNLQQELAANAAAGAKISAQAAPYTIPAGIAYTTTRNILAGVRAGVSIAKIGSTVFEDGGQAFADNLAYSGGSIPRYGGMITGRPHSQGGVKFSMGGARIGEADGRKGEAYIVNTRKNPSLKALASAINVAGGGKSFFDMGGVVKYAGGGITSGVSASTLLPPATADFQTILENLPTPIVLVDDIHNGINQKIQVESGAIL